MNANSVKEINKCNFKYRQNKEIQFLQSIKTFEQAEQLINYCL